MKLPKNLSQCAVGKVTCIGLYRPLCNELREEYRGCFERIFIRPEQQEALELELITWRLKK